MTLLLRDLSIDVSADEDTLPVEVAKILGIDVCEIQEFKVVRRSIDARKKSRIRKIFSVVLKCPNEKRLLGSSSVCRIEKLSLPSPRPLPKVRSKRHVLVVGMGPAGLFAAKRLIESGIHVTLVDRGRRIEQRVKDVESFWRSATLNVKSNAQFGEGGAGTFSDGKLTTRLNHPQRQIVLESLVQFGAPENILLDSRPHVGTDRLRQVIINFRKYLIHQGVDLRFETCLTGIDLHRGRVAAGVFNYKERVSCDAMILATGHSSRDTYEMLDSLDVQMEAKGFAMGLRVEHPAALINHIQYGHFADQLPAADYSLKYNDDKTQRGVYSFCMCPGGEIINTASEPNGIVVNGMSYMARKAQYSNSALVVSVRPEDWGGDKLGGIYFQQKWEREAFVQAGRNFLAPAQNLLSFCEIGSGPITCSCRPGVYETDLRTILPEFVYQGLRRALPCFNQKMRGFLTEDAVLVGIETRTSSPVRINRTNLGESTSHPGLYPTGEGAGFAGGIMSAAFDGLRAAENVVTAALEREKNLL